MDKLRYEDGNIIYGRKSFNVNDDVDMSILLAELNNRMKLQEFCEQKRSITFNDIIEETDWSIEDLMNAEILGMNWAGDEFGFELLGANDKSIHIITNDYYFKFGV